ncbi:hypothetical protein, partial [Mesorhizobium sp. M0205]|uniref:hypothetical protein n=1 Tax=Mesorhizobium sp. M0205 TaxID=2956914 RepID=UPI0033373BA5
MELGEAREVRTTCPYCGVGCGVLAKVGPAREISVPGGPRPPTHIGRGFRQGAGQAANLRQARRRGVPR